VQAVEGEDADVDAAQARLALAHHVARDQVHALGVVREAAGVSSFVAC
jgi:hypothetical protein